MASEAHQPEGVSAANAAETSLFRFRPSGFAETGRSTKSTLWVYESAAVAAHEILPAAVRKRYVMVKDEPGKSPSIRFLGAASDFMKTRQMGLYRVIGSRKRAEH